MINTVWIATYVTAVNIVAALAFGWDKRQARKGGSRISESALMKIAFLGGSLGAKVAQRRFRHKTRKQPFAHQLNLILGFHIALLSAAVIGVMSGIRPY